MTPAAVSGFPRNRPKWVLGRLQLGALVLGFSLVAATACAIRPAVGTSSTAAQTGSSAPDFRLNTLDGSHIRLADLRGKGVVLNFWATWCVPCRTEMPYFERTYRAYQDRGVVFVGAAIEDDPESMRAFVKEMGITYPVGLDEGNRIATAYQLVGLPSTVFIGREGQIVKRASGLISESQLVTFVEEIAR